MAHHAGAYHGFCSMKYLRVFILPPGYEASPSQGYPSIKFAATICSLGWREALREESAFSKNR